MSTARKKKAYTAYDDSYIAIELKKFDAFIADLLKNERDKDATTLLSNIRETFAFLSWLMSRFDKGDAPGIIGIGLITAKLVGMQSTLTLLDDVINNFRSANNITSPETINSPVSQVIYLVSMRIMEIIERAPTIFDEFFPFLNLELLIETAESYGGAKTTDEPANPGRAKEKSVSHGDKGLLTLFPSFFAFLNEVKQLKRADKKEQVALAPNVIRSGFDLYFPVFVRLLPVLPIYQNHQKIQSGSITHDLKEKINESIDQTDEDIDYFSTVNNHYSPDLHENAFKCKNLSSFYKFLLLVQQSRIEHADIVDEEQVDLQRANPDSYIAWPSVKETEVYKAMMALKRHIDGISAQAHDVNSVNFFRLRDIVTNTNRIHVCITSLMSLFDKGRSPTLTEWLKAYYLCSKIYYYLDNIAQHIHSFVFYCQHNPLDAQVDVYLALILTTDKLVSLLPKKINDLVPFVNIDEMITPFSTDGMTKDKLQGLLDYAFSYEKYMPRMHHLVSILQEAESLENLAVNCDEMSVTRLIELSRKYTKFIATVNDFIKFLELKIAKELEKNGKAYSNKFTQLNFLLMMATRVKSKTENALATLQAVLSNKKSIYDEATASLLAELKVEQGNLLTNIEKCNDEISRLPLEISTLKNQHDKINSAIKKLEVFIIYFNCIVESHKDEIFSREENIAKDLNRLAPVSDLYQLIDDHHYTQWNKTSSPILMRKMREEKERLSELADSYQILLAQLDQNLSEGNAKKHELDLSLSLVSKNMAPLIEAAENAMEPAEKIASQTPLLFSSEVGIIQPDKKIRAAVQSHAWKQLFKGYIDDRNDAMFWRDLISIAVAAVLRFFGNISYKPEYEARMAYVTTMDTALDTYAVEGNAKPLTETIQYGITHFKPRADENSPLFGWTMKSHLQIIEKELAASSKP